MKIDSIKNGIVIDHIQAGLGMQLYNLLGLGNLDCSVALIKNAASSKLGKKDIIKIDGDVSISFDVIGFIDPDATVNIIKDGKLVQKLCITAPERIVNVVKCKNPRCITSTEQQLDQICRLTDADTKTYRCIYCDSKL